MRLKIFLNTLISYSRNEEVIHEHESSVGSIRIDGKTMALF